MTCVVGIEHEGAVYIGADSAGVDSYDISIRDDEKVFMNEDFIMGFSGSFRIGQLLRYALVPPEQSFKKDDMAYLVTDFIDAVRNMQREKGALKKENEEESHDSAFLLGYHGRLYIIDEDFQVIRPNECYTAVGAGAAVALGALYASDHIEDPRRRIVLALEASAMYCAAVRSPFTVLKLERNSSEAT